MTEQEHTPGPWAYVPNLSGSANHQGYRIAQEGSAWAHASVQPGDEDGVLGQANARLIATAPEMLEALEQMVDAFGHYSIHPYMKARGAIAKATGKEQTDG